MAFYGGEDLALWVAGCHYAGAAVRGLYLLIDCGQHWLEPEEDDITVLLHPIVLAMAPEFLL